MHLANKYLAMVDIYEWINEDNYEYGDFTKKQFDLKDYSIFTAKHRIWATG